MAWQRNYMVAPIPKAHFQLADLAQYVYVTVNNLTEAARAG